MKSNVIVRRSLVSAIVALCAVVAFSTAAYASSNGGTVSQLNVQTFGGTNNVGLFFFSVSGSRGTMPACATSGNRWVVDLGKQSGPGIQSLVTAAYLSGKQIAVYGSGNCGTWGDTEGVNYILTNP